MKKILILLLFLACKEPDNMDLVISDASEIHFTRSGESSFNLEQLGYIDNQYCFHEKFVCSGERKFQGYDADGDDEDIYLSAYDEDNVELFSTAFTKTSYQLFDPLEDWTEFGGGEVWTGVGTSAPYVDLPSGSPYSNSLKTNIVPPFDESIRVVYDFDNTVTAVDLVMRFRSGGSAVTPLPSGIALGVGNTTGYFDITLDAPADDFFFEIQKSGGAATRVTVNSIKLYRSNSVTDIIVYNTSMIPYDEGMCDKKVQFKITNGVTAVIENGSFDTTIAPATSTAPGLTVWGWNSGAARVTLPSSVGQTEALTIPFSAIAGNTYDFELDVDILLGAGSAGATSRIVISFNDGVSFTDLFDSGALAVGHHTLSMSIPATSNWTVIQIVGASMASSSYGRILDVNSIEASTNDGVEYYYSDYVDFVSEWSNSSYEGRVDIQYKANQNTDDGLIYDGTEDYYMIQVDGQFAQFDYETVEKEIKLTGMSFNTATSFQKKKKLIINDSPGYQHDKIILALQHAAVGSVLVNGEEITLGAGYTLGTERPATYPQRPAEILLNLKNSYKHNVL